MQLLGSAHPYFVRCLKPNMQKTANNFQPPVVLNQLRYSGMMETVRIRRAGFPVRRTFEDFIFRCLHFLTLRFTLHNLGTMTVL
jgi:myosin X